MENEDIEKALSTGGDDKGGSEADLKTQLEKEHARAEMWAGRAKAQGDELKRLHEENAKLKSGKAVEEAVAALPEDVKGDTPADYLKPALAGAKVMVDAAVDAIREENRVLKEQAEKREEKFFVEQIASRNRKFFGDVAPGKDKEKAWEQFKQLNRETYESIRASRDVSRFDRFVDSFYRNIGVQNPASGGASAAPSPTTTGGERHAAKAAPDGDMTTAEFLKERHRAEELRKSGDMAGWREIDARLRRALNEGRVK